MLEAILNECGDPSRPKTPGITPIWRCYPKVTRSLFSRNELRRAHRGYLADKLPERVSNWRQDDGLFHSDAARCIVVEIEEQPLRNPRASPSAGSHHECPN